LNSSEKKHSNEKFKTEPSNVPNYENPYINIKIDERPCLRKSNVAKEED